MSAPERAQEVTLLLRDGSPQAQQDLWSLLYHELKTMARQALRHHHQPGREGRKPGATSLVHEAFLRLLGTDTEWNDRHHFFAVASRAMRFVLVDEARRQVTQKRSAEVPLPAGLADGEEAELPDPQQYRPEEVLAVHQALEQLADLNPRHEKLVELRYFAGLSVEETAEALGVTPRTVVRDWRAVRLWLQHTLDSQPS